MEEPEDFEKLLKQYKTLAKKVKDMDDEREKLIESARVKGVITFTSANRKQISEKSEKINEVYEELRKINDHMLKLIRQKF